MKDRKRFVICLVASAGGHMSQLLKMRKGWNKYKAIYVTTTEVVRKDLSAYGDVYVVGECNHSYPMRVIKVLLKCIKIVFKERPNVVISTGAAAGCLMSFLGKLIGAKVIWIDSITNIKRISFSGRMVRYIADVFIVQWPELEQQYKNVEYIGEVI